MIRCNYCGHHWNNLADKKCQTCHRDAEQQIIDNPYITDLAMKRKARRTQLFKQFIRMPVTMTLRWLWDMIPP